MFGSVLIANRGEIARRVIRTARQLGIRTVAVYSDADEGAPHAMEADQAVGIGPGPAQESYLRGDRIIEVAQQTNVDAVHPGYGFLSENAVFARSVREANLAWIGPDAEVMASLADKSAAREFMADAGVPVAAGGRTENADAAMALADTVGYPLMLKAAAGGGGIGMQVVHRGEDLPAAFEQASGTAKRFFGDGAVFLERYLPDARHVEVQILGLRDGRVVAIGERECSVQRRYQKVVEEAPSPAVTPALRGRLFDAAITGAKALGYENAGTFECLVSGDEFVFLEVNARLQVEHPITELTTGMDLVEEQFRIAAGDAPAFDPQDLAPRGHAIELRIYAEDPVRFFPSPGTLSRWRPPDGDGVRLDAAYGEGDEVTPFYDPLLAKLCVWAPDRNEALDRARRCVQQFEIEGVRTNLPFLARVLADEQFTRGSYDTGIVARLQAG